MKSFPVFAFWFGFALAKIATAEEAPQSKPSPQHTAQPSARTHTVAERPQGIRTSRANAGPNRPAVQRNVAQRNSPSLRQPIQRTPLAMNVQNPRQNYQRRPQLEEPEQRQTPNAKPVTPQNLQRAKNNRNSYADALRRCRHERHDCNWWKRHCRTIVFVNWGYYYLNAGYWYPAYGYDPVYDYYDYDGPIYTYGNLLPDQVITNVQLALRDAGYYLGPITGSLGPATRAALGNFQRDYGLVITGAIDEPTVLALGLI